MSILANWVHTDLCHQESFRPVLIFLGCEKNFVRAFSSPASPDTQGDGGDVGEIDCNKKRRIRVRKEEYNYDRKFVFDVIFFFFF